MAQIFGYIVFKGLDGRTSTLKIDFGDVAGATPGAQIDAAAVLLTEARTKYDAASLATIVETRLTVKPFESADAGAGDLSEKALVNLYLDSGGDKTGRIHIPAPTTSVFLAASGPQYNVVNTGHALVTDLAEFYANDAFISDGEQVDQTVNNGVASGRRITVRIPKS